MSVVYKVWVHVERIDEDLDEYDDANIPFSIGEYTTQEEAERVQKLIVDISENGFNIGR